MPWGDVKQTAAAAEAQVAGRNQYQNPGNFNFLDTAYLGNESIQVLEAILPIAKRAGFQSVDQERATAIAQSEAQKRGFLANILSIVGMAAMFVPVIGPAASMSTSTYAAKLRGEI